MIGKEQVWWKKETTGGLATSISCTGAEACQMVTRLQLSEHHHRCRRYLQSLNGIRIEQSIKQVGKLTESKSRLVGLVIHLHIQNIFVLVITFHKT